MALLKIYDGVSWTTIVAKVWDGAAWQGVLKYWTGTVWEALVSLGTAAISARTVSSNATEPSNPLAQIALRADGTLETRILDANWVVIAGEWFLTGDKTDMEVLVSINSGTLSGGVTGTQALGVIDRVWQKNSTVADGLYKSVSLSFTIKNSAGAILAGPVNITLRARKNASGGGGGGM